MIGNSYATKVHQDWYDAFVGQILLGDGAGYFRPLPLAESGFYVDTDAKKLIQIERHGRPLWVVATNSDRLRFFAPAPPGPTKPVAQQ